MLWGSCFFILNHCYSFDNFIGAICLFAQLLDKQSHIDQLQMTQRSSNTRQNLTFDSAGSADFRGDNLESIISSESWLSAFRGVSDSRNRTVNEVFHIHTKVLTFT